MANYVIFVDSTADVGLDLRKKYDIDYCPMNVNWAGEEKIASLDWDQGFSAHDFYQTIREGTRIFTTAVPQTVFEEKFSKVLKEGKDILYIACSSKLSCSVNTAATVAKTLLKNYPDRKIIALDPKVSGFAQAMLAFKASEMRKAGKSLEETAKEIDKVKLEYNQWCTVESLTYLAKAGRVKASKAFFGNLFGVKPIIVSDVNGSNYACMKVKGRKGSLDELVNRALENVINPESNYVCISHADDIEAANYIKTKLLEKINPKELIINNLGPIVGASAGPGAVCVCFHGKPVTIVGEE